MELQQPREGNDGEHLPCSQREEEGKLRKDAGGEQREKNPSSGASSTPKNEPKLVLNFQAKKCSNGGSVLQPRENGGR